MFKVIIKYIGGLLYAFDQFCNAAAMPLNIFLGDGSYKFGHADETISGVLGKNIRAGHCKGCYYLCKALNFIEFWRDDEHCDRAIEEDEHAGYK